MGCKGEYIMEIENNIAMPVLTYRFRVIIKDATTETNTIISKAILKCNIHHDVDLINLSIIENLELTNAQKVIRQLCKHPGFSVIVQYTDGSKNSIINNVYADCKVVFHDLTLSYGEDNIATHKIQIEFKDYYSSVGDSTISYN